MEKSESITLSLQPEELGTLLDIVISALGKLHVELFHANDPALHAALEKRGREMEAILRKLISLGQWTGGNKAESKSEFDVSVQEKAA